MENSIKISARVSPTENAEKIVAAIRNIFPDALVDAGSSSEETIKCRSADASRLREMIFSRRILDTVRSALISSSRQGSTRLELNRQAAAAGRLAIDAAGGGALGPLVVEFESPDMEAFIDRIAPRTEKGRPVNDNVE